MSRKALGTVLVFCTLFVAIGLVVAGGDDDQTTEITKLIEDLGHEEYHVREAAEKRLIQIGPPAVPALKKAMENDDPEVAQRARRAHEHLTNATPEEQKAVRQKAEAAFNEGKYEDAAALYGRLAAHKTPTVDDLLWVGHAYQLAGNWKAAVVGYRLALERVDFLHKHPEAPAKPQPRNFGGGRVLHGEWFIERRDQRVVVRNRRKTLALKSQGEQLRLLIGLIEREEIGDLKAAADTFAKAADRCDDLKHTVPHMLAEYEGLLRRQMAGERVERDPFAEGRQRYPLWCLKELAVTQERMGHVAEALAAWDKVRLIRLRYGSGDATYDIQAMGRLLQKLSADKPLPEITFLLVMSLEKKSYSLDYSDPKLLARAYATPYTQSSHPWNFACSAPPGQEVAALEVSCDIEQHSLGYGGQFRCWVKPYEGGEGRIYLGRIHWPKDKPAGWDVITKQFDVPAGAGLVHIQTRSLKNKFTVHGITIKPTFRPRAKDSVAPIGGAWIQKEALPRGGTWIYDGEDVGDDFAKVDFPAGRHTFAYEVGGRNDGKRFEATLVPGAHYGLFINLDSPFATTLTNLRHFSEHPLARSSMVRLPDGRWLVAYTSNEGRGAGVPLKIMLSTSKDFVTWEKPWPLSHNSIFLNKTPSLLVDEKGIIWLAWFSNRLHLARTSSAGYRLWLAHSRDGKTWSRPMPVDCGSDGPESGAQMARGPKGKYWMFVGGRAVSADSPGGFMRLSPITVDGRDSKRIRTPHVVWDSENRMHMVYADWINTIWHATSQDGKQWTNPMLIVPKEEGRIVANPQLILDGKRVGVVYENNSGAWLLRSMLNASGKSLGGTSAPIKITHHVIPLQGSRLSLTPDGRVVVLAGTDTVWLLHGELDKILRGVSRDD